jgi:PTH2 family peptidyl-tRNA hydrolase
MANHEDMKQVLVMRTDLKNMDGKKIRTGKTVAQAGHGFMAFLTRRLQSFRGKKISDISECFSKEEWQWMDAGFTKVVVKVESEQELLDIFHSARSKGLQAHLITDSGRTEFGGIPTNTCVGIGPDTKSKVDEVTGHLPLL